MLFSLVAGHETSSSALTFAIGLLAYRPEIQHSLQQDLDRILGGRNPGDWAYHIDCVALLDGYFGAVVFETLRLWTALPASLRTDSNGPLPISANGRRCVLPKGTDVLLHANAAHTHPDHWSSWTKPDGVGRASRPTARLSAFEP